MKTNIQRLFQIITSHLGVILLFPASFLLFSFIPGDNEKTHAPTVRKELIIGSPFQSISINGNISLILTNKPAGNIAVEGNENDVNKLQYKIKNNELTIDAVRKKKSDPLTIYVSAVMLKHMLINGNGLISSTGTIKTDDLSIWLNGVINVDINVVGKVSVDTYDGYDLLWKSH